MEPLYTWQQIERAIDAHGAKLLKQIEEKPNPIVDGVPDLSMKVGMRTQIDMATKSIKENIKHYLENPEVNYGKE